MAVVEFPLGMVLGYVQILDEQDAGDGSAGLARAGAVGSGGAQRCRTSLTGSVWR